MIIITKVENNRITKFLPVLPEESIKKLEEINFTFEDAFIYDGDYSPNLWIENGIVSFIENKNNIQELIKLFTESVQRYLDAKAKNNGYDNIISACSYAGAPNPFQTESIQFITWRGNVWAYCYQELDKVQNGERPIPELQDFLNELPSFE